jgi:GT2 family glycosyltransferase
MAPRALVVVAAYNQLALLRLSLRGYLRQTNRDFALVVADDGSTDGTAAWLAEVQPRFEAQGIPFLHVHQEDAGFRKCRILNDAVRRGPAAGLLVFSDGDCIPPADFVAQHLAAHEPRSLHVAGAWRLTREQTEAISEADVDVGRFETLRTAESEKDIRKKARQSRWGTLLRRRHRPKILGLNMAIDRALFEELNGFDECFESWGLGEDTDLRDRAMRTRPRPRVKVLYGVNDVYHLWHPVHPGGRAGSMPYYRQARPVRCEHGLTPAERQVDRLGACQYPEEPQAADSEGVR